MSKILELLAKYIGIPLLEKLGKYLLKEFKKWQSDRKLKKEIEKKVTELNEAKDENDIRRINRNLKL